jgi:glycosyltransferase involved in cell wall biosynthesis
MARPGLRVAHVVATFPPYLAGTGNVAYHNALELARLGHDVHVFAAAGAHGVPGWRDPPELPVHRLPAPVRIGNAPLTPGLLSGLAGFQLVHLHWPYMFGAELTWLAARRAGVPYVMTYHIDLIGSGLRAPLFALYQAIWMPRLVRDASAVYAVSLDHFASTQAAPTVERYGVPLREIANGVDLATFSPGDRGAARARLGLPSEADLILFVAALDRAHYYKGLSRLLRALPALPLRARLIVVGDGDLRAGYEAEAASGGVAERVHFAGAVGHAGLSDYYRAADVTVLPSTHTESFGLVLAESLASGTPAVASDLPGVRSVVDHGETGYLVSPSRDEELVEALRRLLSDPAARVEFGRAGRRKAEARYDWRRIARDLEDAYGEALARRRRS